MWPFVFQWWDGDYKDATRVVQGFDKCSDDNTWWVTGVSDGKIIVGIGVADESKGTRSVCKGILLSTDELKVDKAITEEEGGGGVDVCNGCRGMNGSRLVSRKNIRPDVRDDGEVGGWGCSWV